MAIEEPSYKKSNSTPSWEVNVNVKFFVLDQIPGQYLIIPDAIGEEKRFDWMKIEWCFPNLLSHDTLNDPSKGYLVNDCCVFGVGVSVLGNTRHGEAFTLDNNGSWHFTLREIKIQMGNISLSFFEWVQAKRWFAKLSGSWGYICFVPLDLMKEGSGYVVNDSIIIEAELIDSQRCLLK
ncbi:hypothetical protein Tsubulata_001101 [Turnera subulata]|uniref:MATH domain-containing protein n=1 Tax=Turnera subulata TaxID=218843 RepID=A0A9Q0G0F0_9ROSI|nr:hypothetical protein Tsubulata_001101 [Turnera subulata]